MQGSQPGSCLRGLLWYKGKNTPQRASNNLGQFSNSGTRKKSEGSRALRQARGEKKTKTTQHFPCSYLSGTAVPRIAYSETRKLREQQGRAESWPFEKKKKPKQQKHSKTTQKGRRRNMDSSCSGSRRHEQVNPEYISQSLFLKALQTHGTAIKSSRPSLCSWEANLALVESGKGGGASQHQPLDATPTQPCTAARTQTASRLCPDLCLYLFLYSICIPISQRLTGWTNAFQRESAVHFRDAISGG